MAPAVPTAPPTTPAATSAGQNPLSRCSITRTDCLRWRATGARDMSCSAKAGAAIAVDRTAAAVKSFRFIRCLLVVTPGQRPAVEDLAKFHPVPLQTDVRFL